MYLNTQQIREAMRAKVNVYAVTWFPPNYLAESQFVMGNFFSEKNGYGQTDIHEIGELEVSQIWNTKDHIVIRIY